MLEEQREARGDRDGSVHQVAGSERERSPAPVDFGKKVPMVMDKQTCGAKKLFQSAAPTALNLIEGGWTSSSCRAGSCAGRRSRR